MSSRALALALLLGIAPFVFLPIEGEFENPPKIAWLAIGVGLLALLSVVPARSVATRVDPLDAATILFLAWSAFGIAFAVNPGLAVESWLLLAAAGIAYAVVSRAVAPEDYRGLDRAALFGVAGVVALGLAQARLGFDALPQNGVPSATFGNRNMAAHYVAIALPSAVFAAREAGRVWRVAGAAVALGAGWFLWETQTRAAWLAVGAALLVAGLSAAPFLRSGRRFVAAVASAALASALAVVALRGYLLGFDVTGTLGLRGIYWRNALAMVGEAPLIGVGLGNFPLHYPRYHRAAATDWTFGETFQLERVHNDHLQMLVETGAVGAVLWAGLFFAALGAAAGARERRRASVALQTVAAFAVVATFSFPTERALPPFLFWVALGQLRGLTVCRRGPALPVPKAAVAGVVVAYLALAGWRLPRDVRAEAARSAGRLEEAARLTPWEPAIPLRLAGVAAGEGRFDEAVRLLERTTDLHPDHVNALLNLGWCRLQQGRDDEARAWFTSALALFPGSMTGHTNLGLIALRSGDTAAAARHYLRVVELADAARPYGRPSGADRHKAIALVQLGQVRAGEGRVEEAISLLREGIALAPDLTAARALLTRLQGKNPEKSP